MKKFFLSLCVAAFLGAGLVSCADEAAEIVPKDSTNSQMYLSDGDKPMTEGPKKPGTK